LYWHFKNKQNLLDDRAKTMIADAFSELEQPATNELWAEWLAEVAERFHLTLLIHRDAARIVAATDLTKSVLLGIQELALSVLTTAGFDLRAALMGLVAIFEYTLGAAFEEQSEPDHPKWGHSSLLQSRCPSLDPARLPRLVVRMLS